MDWPTRLLPITVISGIALFIAKEAIEWLKRARADKRKRSALRTLLARECELNHWAYKRIKDAIEDIKSNFENQEQHEYSIERRKSGEVIFQRAYRDVRWSSFPLPPVQAEQMGKLMLEVAIIDIDLFASLEAAYDSMINLNHVRQSLIDHIEDEDEGDELAGFFETFPEYGLGELATIKEDLEALYRACTEKSLEGFRIR
ncbi:hypothetical protein [Rhodoplanes azumiensis]|uniref:Uncharacterized protein n=1 Tax=Rhodoplanes azumiensis TaxID=1897628 RepID=A0ABW5AJN6_9BRAD